MKKLILKGDIQVLGIEKLDYPKAFIDGNGKYKDLTEGVRTIFPIIRLNDKVCQPIATGFFISNNGMFVTAKHVMEENGLFENDLAGIEILKNDNRLIIREVVKFVSHPFADLSVGMLRTEGPHTNKLVTLTKEFPKVGEKILTWSFPCPKEEYNNENKTIKFNFLSSGGIVTNHFPKGRDNIMLPYNCFEAKMEIKGGSSGGPVAFGNGSIFGIISSSIEGTDISYITSIHALFELSLPNMLPPGEDNGRDMTIKEIIERELIILE